MTSDKLYFDYNATTPVDQRVLESMLPYFTQKFGNASSKSHAYGWDAEEGVTIAREQVAELLGAKPNEIIFTSGATESINLALSGFCQANRDRGNHIITCCTEHKAVLDTCGQLEKLGFDVTYLPVDESGNIDLEELEATITERTIMVCLMFANNETGVVHPMQAISAIAKRKNVCLFSDATQVVGKLKLNFSDLGVDMAAFSAHKIYGPKGIGGLYVSSRTKPAFEPILFGGGQERKLRPGTLNVPGIVGMGIACELLLEEQDSEIKRLSALRDQLETGLGELQGIKIIGLDTERLPNTTNCSLENIDGSKLIRSLKNLAVSQGSACSSAIIEPSHVLKSMGISDELALSSIRISLGRFTTEEEVVQVISEVDRVANSLKLTIS